MEGIPVGDSQMEDTPVEDILKEDTPELEDKPLVLEDTDQEGIDLVDSGHGVQIAPYPAHHACLCRLPLYSKVLTMISPVKVAKSHIKKADGYILIWIPPRNANNYIKEEQANCLNFLRTQKDMNVMRRC